MMTTKMHGLAFTKVKISDDWLNAIPKKIELLEAAKRAGIPNCETMTYDELDNVLYKLEKAKAGG